VQALAEARLDLVRAILERRQRVVPLALDGGAEALQPFLDPLCGCVADVIQPLAEHTLGLARESLDRKIELAAQPAGGLLARAADRRVELQRGRLRVAGRLA
jgi:hypothetical protein